MAGFKREKHKFYDISDSENQPDKKKTSTKKLKILNKIKDGIIEEETDFNDINNSNNSKNSYNDNVDGVGDDEHGKTIKSVKTFAKKQKSSLNI